MISETIAHYHILEKLGAGGMGEVYRATDTRLVRDVALKVLPEAYARDGERMARFEREAKVLASLNHPNIALIYGLEESGVTRALVMELVEGPTLSERIKGAIPLDEALPIAKQIAEALEYAHERGIIHRDLKPSNVKVTRDGQVKVLDFGLAKALEGEASQEELQNSPTLTASRGGVLLGTAAYMSPEQARGKRVDRRSDIWAFGCVLYEMLTGKRTFNGETISDTLAAVIKSEPDWTSLAASTPQRIRELLRRCLQKDPKQRLRDIGEARIAIEKLLSGSDDAETAPGVAPPQSPWRRAMPWAAGILIGSLATALIFWSYRVTPAPRPVGRLSIEPPSGDSIVPGNPSVAISPDGTELVYRARHEGKIQLYLRRTDRFEASPLPGTQGAQGSFFSPDGQWLGFRSEGKLKKISLQGGAPVVLCDASNLRGASWGPDDTIIFSPTFLGGLMRVSASGGTPQALTTPDTGKGERSHRWPEILPGGKAIVFNIAQPKDIGYLFGSKIVVERLDTHERKILPLEGSDPRYSPSGHLIFAREAGLFAVPFELNRLEVSGPPVLVLDGVRTFSNTGMADFAISRTGSLVYLPGSVYAAEGLLAWVDRKNQTQTLAAPVRGYSFPHVSPDGQRVAVMIASGTTTDVWVFNIPHGTLTRLTFDGHSSAPVWMPDGKRIAYTTNAGSGGWAILSKAADGSGAEGTLLSGQSTIQIPESWSPDGKFLAVTTFAPDKAWSISIVPLQGDRKPRPFVQTAFLAAEPRFSPDGHWIAYTSEESGGQEVYVQPFPGPGGKWQVSTEGGARPVWARNGRELFYLMPSTPSEIMSVEISIQPGFNASTPRSVADVPTELPVRFGNGRYDVSADGQRFLFTKASEENAPPGEVRVVLNWSEELKRLAPTGKQP
ncbi:MAG: protein kinase [Candidatus Acidiferrales bacterium]